MKKDFKVALALGGGGARGFAHIGVIKTLKANAIPIDLITGISMGAIVGALYCLEDDIDIVKNKLLDMASQPAIRKLESFFVQSTEENHHNLIIKKLLSRVRDFYLWNLKTAKRWLIRTEPIIDVLEGIFDDKGFSDLKIPFACVAVDLNAACEVLIKEGRILDAILASSSIPGVFAPLKWKDQLLADGGILSSIPARQARILGADFVIGVDLTPDISKKELLSGLDAIHQAEAVRTHHIKRLNLRYCDLVIKPATDNISWVEFSKGSFCIQQGELTALRYIGEIKQSLVRRKRFYFLKRLFSKRRKYLD